VVVVSTISLMLGRILPVSAAEVTRGLGIEVAILLVA